MQIKLRVLRYFLLTNQFLCFPFSASLQVIEDWKFVRNLNLNVLILFLLNFHGISQNLGFDGVGSFLFDRFYTFMRWRYIGYNLSITITLWHKTSRRSGNEWRYLKKKYFNVTTRICSTQLWWVNWLSFNCIKLFQNHKFFPSSSLFSTRFFSMKLKLSEGHCNNKKKLALDSNAISI